MPTQKPTPIPIPIMSFPGANPQESAGRLINSVAEPLGDPQRKTGPADQVWRRQPGLSQFNLQQTGQSGYRGGIVAGQFSYETWLGNASTVDASGNVVSLGLFPGAKKISIARNQAINPDVIAVDLDNGAFILNASGIQTAHATLTIGGTITPGDTFQLQVSNTGVTGWPQFVNVTAAGGDTAPTIAAKIVSGVNANTTLATGGFTAAAAAAVVTFSQQGNIANNTFLIATWSGAETAVLSPVNGQMAGGAGTVGINFIGPPLAYNAQLILPQVNSVTFLDGYFIFTAATGRVWASGTNNLTVNGLSYIDVVYKSDVTLLRGIAFSGLLWLFTTGSVEIWQDTAQPYPGFPFSRLLPLDIGLVQPNAIAGWETGFNELIWVAQDNAVWWCTVGSTKPIKISHPDLDRLISNEVIAGNTLEAGVYVIDGKKFWVLSSPDWSWEFNLSTQRWSERWSLIQVLGTYGRWRATGGHPAFGKWLMGDVLSGNIIFTDRNNYTEMGVPQLFRIETGPVRDFPNQIRIARADFDFDNGTGQYVGSFKMIVLGAAAASDGTVQLLVNQTNQARTGDICIVSGVLGTTEANGIFPITVVDATHIKLPVNFAHTYTSGGLVVDQTSPPQAVAPVCEISCSKDGGTTWGNPLIRQLGPLGHVKRMRASVKNMGLSGPQGTRWRIDVTDPVYTGILGATQSSDPREVGA